MVPLILGNSHIGLLDSGRMKAIPGLRFRVRVMSKNTSLALQI